MRLPAGRRSLRSAGALPAVLRTGIGLVSQADRRGLRGLALLQVLTAVLLGLQVLLFREVLNAALGAEDGSGAARALVLPLAALLVISLVGALLPAALALLQRGLTERVTRTVVDRILDTTTRLPLLAFEQSELFDRLQRLRSGAVLRPVLVTQSVLQVLGSVLGGLVVVGVLLSLEPLTVPVLALAAVPALLVSGRAGRLEFAFAVEQSESARRRNYVTALLTGRLEAPEVRAFDLTERLRRRLASSWEDYLSALDVLLRRRLRLAAVSGLGVAATLLLSFSALLGLLAAERLTVAEVGAAAIAIRLLAARVDGAAQAGGRLVESRLFLQDLELFTAQSGEERGGAAAPQDGPAVIALERVGFRYPGAELEALVDVALQVRRGELVVLVGANGSGKTTLAKVLSGLLPPTSGRVLWDGVDLQELDPVSVRARTTVLLQDFLRYALPARDNIALDASADDVVEAARRARIDEVLGGLPSGYDTVLSKEFAGGTELSGGQWQRVALARGVHRDTPIVVLDEPTAALDADAEADLADDLRTLLAGRTAVVVSHRLSLATRADRVVVLEAGRVVEDGPHRELLAAGGLYARLFRRQAAAYLPDEAAVRR